MSGSANWAILLALAPTSVGCGDGASIAERELRVSDGWSRPTPPGVSDAAFYMSVQNGTLDRDRLVSVSSDRCARIELHKSEVVNDMMYMEPAAPDDLVIPRGRTLVMEPTGLHVMCLTLTEPLAEGDEIELTLTFATAGDRTVDVIVGGR